MSRRGSRVFDTSLAKDGVRATVARRVQAFVWLLAGLVPTFSFANVDLVWDPVTDERVALYEVWYGQTSGQYAQQVESADNVATVEGLAQGQTHYFVVRACNADRSLCSGFSNEVSATLTNQSPDAVDDTATVAEDSTDNTITVLANDTDGDGDALTVTGASAVNGAVSVNPNGTLRYTPNADFRGTDTISYAISDGAGGNDTATVTVNVTPVYDAPAAGFVTNKTMGEAPLMVLFTDASSGEITARDWQFGDGGSESNTTQLTHTYHTPGDYTVSLTVTGPGGSATETKTNLIRVVEAAPEADFSVRQIFGGAPLTVAITDNSSGSISSYLWDFGDGGASSAAGPQHSYAAPGDYAVTLTVTGPGGSDTKTEHVHVSAIGEPVIEAGEIALDHKWIRVDFQRQFNDPVVVVKSLSVNGAQPAVLRVDGVDSEGFWVRIQEWDYLDGAHATETASYLVVERGIHQLSNGAWIEANRVEANAEGFTATEFTAPFAEAPVVLSAVTTFNEAEAVTPRLRDIDPYRFELRLQEQEANPQQHALEAVDYIAWEPSVGELHGLRFEVGRTADAVRHEPYILGFSSGFTRVPLLLADMQSTDGGDPANLRWDDKNAASVAVWVDEDTSLDEETAHTTETVGYVAVIPTVKLEAGEIALNHKWIRVDFQRQFDDPVVVVKSLSVNGAQPAVLRVDAVDSEGFWVRIQEWDYLDGAHATETASYLVVERGIYQLSNGAWIEADRVEANAEGFTATEFTAPFADAPVVLSAVTTFNEAEAVTPRLRDIDPYRFELLLQEQEANPQQHALEAVDYIAWEPSVGELHGLRFEVGRTADAVRHEPYTLGFSSGFTRVPLLLADLQSTDGGDTSNLRWGDKNAASVAVWVDEETSLDEETAHTTEIVGYVAVTTDEP